MKCLHPIIIKYRPKKPVLIEENNFYEEKIINVPCRKCPECQRKYSLEWVRRFLHEYETSNYNGSFITLTFEQEPLFGVSKNDLQKFFKRLRKNTGRYIKYYACGEYGEKNGRAHYHALLIGVKPSEKETILYPSWKFGIIDAKPIQYGSAKYVVDYMNKIIPDEIIDGRNKPFTLKSKGIGLNWFKKYLNEIIDDKCITDKGHKVSIPRYYLKKLKDGTIDNGKLYYEIITSNDEIKEEDFTDYNDDNYKYVVQHNVNISSLRKLK